MSSKTEPRSGLYYGQLHIQLRSIRGGAESLQVRDWKFTRSGYGAGQGVRNACFN